jgi:hypothetical protein
MKVRFGPVYHSAVNNFPECDDLISPFGFETDLDQLASGKWFMARHSTASGGKINHGTNTTLICNDDGLTCYFSADAFLDDSNWKE